MMILFNNLSHLTRLVLVGAALLASPVHAGTEETGRELAAVESELQNATEKQASLVREMMAAIKAQEDLSTRLVALAKTAATQEETLARANGRLADLAQQKAHAELALAEKRDVLSLLLAGLQRLEQNPPPALVVEPDDVLKALRGAMMFGAVIPELRSEAQTLHADLERLATLKADFDAERQRQTDALSALNLSRTEMKNLLAEKRAAAAQSVENLGAEKQKALALGEKARTLKELLVALEKARLQEIERQSLAEQARAEAERLRLAALVPPALAFSLAKGQLALPAQGQVVRNFGDENGMGGKLDGILIATGAKAQVLAPAAGRIEYAGEFRSYGKLLILNPGEGYLVLMSGMEEISSSPGQSVKAGEPVGLMGEKQLILTLASGLTNQNAPVLYIEFRKKNVSVDPAPWWVGSRKEASR